MSLPSEQRMSVSSKLLTDTLGYLAQHPYREVAQLIHALQQDALVIETTKPAAPPAPETAA